MNLPVYFQNLFGNEEYSYFHVYPTSSDGNCLFTSVQIALESIGMKYSAQHLRNVVAYGVLDLNDKETTATLETWKELLSGALQEKNRNAFYEYSHVLPLLQNKEIDLKSPNSIEIRKQVHQKMSQNNFWGEEYALRILEQRLLVNFLVISLEYFGTRQKHIAHKLLHGDKKYEYYIILFRNGGEHYEPISYKQQFIFHYKSLPHTIKNMFQI